MSFCGTSPAACVSPECDKPAVTRGRCHKHYKLALVSGELEKRDHSWKASERFDGRDDPSGEKCTCGLRLPCNDCLPKTATEYAFTRMYAPNNWPEGEHRMWLEPKPKTNERQRRVVVSSR